MAEGKIGAGHAHAMARLGLKELRNAVSPSREGVADAEVGLYGTLTQGEIAQARGGPGAGSEQESKLSLAALREHAAGRAREADLRMEKGREPDGPQRGE